MTFAAALRPPVHSWREDVSLYFPGSPSPLFRTQTLCAAQAAAGDFVVVDAGSPPHTHTHTNLPLLAASEKQTVWQKMVS